MELLPIGKMKEKIHNLIREREWDKYQSPKNISMALSIEASELLEIFLWLTEDESWQIKTDPEKIEEIQDELADVLYWLLLLSDLLNIDLNDAFWNKIKKNEAKYPIDQCKGSSKKYTEWSTEADRLN